MELRNYLQILAVNLGLASALPGLTAQVDPKDSEVIDQLRQAGSDLSKPHNIDYYLYFPSRAAAAEAGERVKKLGLTIKRLDAAAVGSDWLVLASNRMVPTAQAIAKVSAELKAVAKAGKGEYDGWEAEITR